ncbi:MAG: hypothetical protein ACTSYD_04900 [Candidatus Heimdallarchaeaceae archaeon]
MSDGKQIWGTTRYFIKIEPTSNLFNTSLSGTVSFYDTRGLIEEKTCNNLHQLVRTVYEFWSTILAPHETRVARWLEEYFAEMGIVSDYRLLLKLIRSEELLERPIEELIGETEILSKEKFKEALSIPKNSDVIARKITITKYPEDDYGINELIQKIIEINKITEPKSIKREIHYQLGAEDIVQKEKSDIEIGERLGIYQIRCKIQNTYNESITDMVIEETIPYFFKISDIESSHDYSSETIPTEEGYLLRIKLDEIKSEEELNIKCSLSKRIVRTIVETYNDHIILIQTYADIEQSGLDFRASLQYINISNTTINRLYIIDEIPPEYQILRTSPDAIPPQGIIEKVKMKGSIIRWRYKSIHTNTTISHTYDLDYYPYLFKYRKTIRTKDNKDILKCVKIIRPLHKESGYKVIFALKSLIPIDNTVSITDTIPSDHTVVSSLPASEQLLETIGEDGNKHITWVTKAPEPNHQIQLEVHITTTTQAKFGGFSVQIGTMKETKVIERTSIIQRDLITQI